MLMKKKEKILLDIVNDKCPITFVKTKIALEKLLPHQYLAILVKRGEALEGLPSSLKELGYKIEKKEKKKNEIFYLEISRQT